MTKEYNSKSALILQRYTPEAIQELLCSGESKSAIANRLKVHIKAFNEYMQKHNLIYEYSKKLDTIKKPDQINQVEKYGEKPVNHLTCKETEDPIKRFNEIFAKKKEKRALRELKNPYDW